MFSKATKFLNHTVVTFDVCKVNFETTEKSRHFLKFLGLLRKSKLYLLLKMISLFFTKIYLFKKGSPSSRSSMNYKILPSSSKFLPFWTNRNKLRQFPFFRDSIPIFSDSYNSMSTWHRNSFWYVLSSISHILLANFPT